MKRIRTILVLFVVVGLIFLAVFFRVSHDKKRIPYDRLLVYFVTLDLGEIEHE
jgi:hypothetical protein